MSYAYNRDTPTVVSLHDHEEKAIDNIEEETEQEIDESQEPSLPDNAEEDDEDVNTDAPQHQVRATSNIEGKKPDPSCFKLALSYIQEEISTRAEALQPLSVGYDATSFLNVFPQLVKFAAILYQIAMAEGKAKSWSELTPLVVSDFEAACTQLKIGYNDALVKAIMAGALGSLQQWIPLHVAPITPVPAPIPALDVKAASIKPEKAVEAIQKTADGKTVDPELQAAADIVRAKGYHVVSDERFQKYKSALALVKAGIESGKEKVTITAPPEKEKHKAEISTKGHLIPQGSINPFGKKKKKKKRFSI